MDGADRVTSSGHFSWWPKAAPPASVAGSLETRGAGTLRVLGWLEWPRKIEEGAGNTMVGAKPW
jgi:hypothetical protein